MGEALCRLRSQGFTSPPVRLNLDDLMLKRAGEAAVKKPSCSAFGPPKKNARKDNPTKSAALQEVAAAADDDMGQDSEALEAGENGIAEAPEAARNGCADVAEQRLGASGAGRAAAERQGRANIGLSKKYGPGFLWGQLNGWYKQTVFDPTASLSAERRGTISMPDIEACYGQRSRYSKKVSAPCKSCSIRGV